MVSKVAVIALVAIVACPILLGYAMNLNEVTITDYKVSDDTVQVTPLLQTSTGYSYAHADPLQMNTNFLFQDKTTSILPMYETVTTSKTSFHGNVYYASSSFYPTSSYTLANYSVFFWQFNYDVNVCSLSIKVWFNNNNSSTYNNVHTVHFDDNNVVLSRYTSQTSFTSTTIQNVDHVTFSVSGSWSSSGSYQIYNNINGANTDFIDISGGWRFETTPTTYGNPPYHPVYTNLPDYTRSVLFTVDLSSITQSSYAFNIGNIIFTKTTTDGVVHWVVSENRVDPIDPFEIYYDQSSSNNTYQLRMTADTSGIGVGSGYYRYGMDYQIRYVGAWPNIIGEANYYQSYDFSSSYVQLGALNLAKIAINNRSDISPVMRIDDALYRAFEFPVIDNQSYDPSQFKTNPSTTISNVQRYGISLEFGGNTYDVSEGNITLGTHKVSINNLVLSSVPNSNGGYDNKIGNSVVSTTADPSTIKFNGEWVASISTVSQEQYTYSKTEWTPGQFGWDGIDQNFLMVGLLTSIGVFIALGLYIRRSRSSLWPLLVVCGGAVVLFFIML